MDSIMLAIGGFASTIAQLVSDKISSLNSDRLSFLYSDEDGNDLASLDADEECKILLGKRHKKKFPTEIFNEADKVFMVVGLGGKTGTEFILPAIRAAKSAGVAEINLFVGLPFIFEGKKRITKAFDKLEEISDCGIDHLEIFNNEEIMGSVLDSEDMDGRPEAVNELIAQKIADIISNHNFTG